MARGGGFQKGMEKPKNAKATFVRLMSYLKPYLGKMICMVLLIVLASLANILQTMVLEPIINVIKGEPLGAYQWLADLVAPSGEKMHQFWALVIVMLSIQLCGVLGSLGYNWISTRVTTKVLRQLRLDMFSHMEDLPISYFDQRTHGEIMSTYTNDTGMVRELLAGSFPSIVQSSILVCGFVVAMLINNWLLTLVCFVQIGANALLVKFVGGNARKYFARQQKSLAEVNGYVEEICAGQKVVKVFTHEPQVLEEFDKRNNEYRKNAFKSNVFGNSFGPIINNVSHIFYAIIVAIGALMLVNADKTTNTFSLWGVFSVAITTGSWVSFLEFSRRFSNPFSQLAQVATSIMGSLAGGERVFQIIDEKAEEDEGYVTLVNCKEVDGQIQETTERTHQWAWKHFHKADDTTTYVPLKGDIEFEDVTFSYVEGKVVLKNVSLYAKPGQKIALVGSTGAGKTTITNLINRFYPLDKGKIRYDGINVEKIAKDDLRRSLAMVLQDTHLFTGTVMENIRYGRLDATDEECIEASKTANAHFFISHLPDGYDTMLTADGANLSQGQRQLISIARAAVADPPVLILDEATSSIDTRTERLIEKGMDALMQGRTVFVIAHRLSTVRNSDAIMVMEKGEIIERGTHDQLIEQKGQYYRLYTGAFELD